MKECEYCHRTEEETPICRFHKKIMVCSAHYRQLNKYGKITMFSRITPNEIIIKDKYAELITRNTQNDKITGIFKIDIEDIDKIRQYKWHIFKNTGRYYCGRQISINNKNCKHQMLHQFLMPDAKFCIDHINRDTTDNRKINLRYANFQQNSLNRSISKNNKSGKMGVSIFKRNKYKNWCVQLKCNGVRVICKCFYSKEEAIRARIEAEIKYFGEMSPA